MMSGIPPANISQANALNLSGNTGSKIRLERLTVRNLKALDHLEIDFPAPDIQADPDVFVMGSKNGLGKTSLLEACFIVFLASIAPRELSSSRLKVDIRDYTGDYTGDLSNLPDMIIRAGAQQAELEGTFLIGQQKPVIKVRLERNGSVTVEGDLVAFEKFMPFTEITRVGVRQAITRFIYLLAGFNNDSPIIPPYFYFHSYRKIQEGNLDLSQLFETNVRPSRHRVGLAPPTSTFKRVILQLFMGRGKVFVDLDYKEADVTLVQLNNLVKQYAGGYIEKLRTSERGTIEFPITPSSGGSPFTFDGLSSGQKEIISTLFLIWYYTRNQPSIILIDEPELHLNAEWHRSFMHSLHKLAPHNQYLIATHSEDISASVDKERRILLTQ